MRHIKRVSLQRPLTCPRKASEEEVAIDPNRWTLKKWSKGIF